MSNELNKDNIILSKRFLAIVITGLLCIYALAFISGYFWGKYSAIQELLTTCEEKALEHEVSSALYSLSLNQNDAQKEQLLTQDSAVTVVIAENQEAEQEAEDSSVQTSEKQLSLENSEGGSILLKNSTESDQKTILYYAQLIGFNTKKAANLFLQRAQKNSTVPLMLKERISEGSNNRKKRWYQVVTQPYENKEVLEKDIQSLIQKEKLAGVTIAVYA